MTKYSDPADICRYNLLKQSLKLPQVNSICKLGHHSDSFMIPQWVFSTNLGLEAGGLSIGKNSTLEKFFFICTIVMKFMISVIYSNTN